MLEFLFAFLVSFVFGYLIGMWLRSKAMKGKDRYESRNQISVADFKAHEAKFGPAGLRVRTCDPKGDST